MPLLLAKQGRQKKPNKNRKSIAEPTDAQYFKLAAANLKTVILSFCDMMKQTILILMLLAAQGCLISRRVDPVIVFEEETQAFLRAAQAKDYVAMEIIGNAIFRPGSLILDHKRMFRGHSSELIIPDGDTPKRQYEFLMEMGHTGEPYVFHVLVDEATGEILGSGKLEYLLL